MEKRMSDAPDTTSKEEGAPKTIEPRQADEGMAERRRHGRDYRENAQQVLDLPGGGVRFDF
jgi:hypothetical protein